MALSLIGVNCESLHQWWMPREMLVGSEFAMPAYILARFRSGDVDVGSLPSLVVELIIQRATPRRAGSVALMTFWNRQRRVDPSERTFLAIPSFLTTSSPLNKIPTTKSTERIRSRRHHPHYYPHYYSCLRSSMCRIEHHWLLKQP